MRTIVTLILGIASALMPSVAHGDKVVREDGEWTCEATVTNGLDKEVCRFQNSADTYTLFLEEHLTPFLRVRRNCLRQPGQRGDRERPARVVSGHRQRG